MRSLPELSRNTSRMNWETAFGRWANLKNILRLGSRCSSKSPSDVTIRHCDDFDITWAAKLQVKFNGT